MFFIDPQFSIIDSEIKSTPYSLHAYICIHNSSNNSNNNITTTAVTTTTTTTPRERIAICLQSIKYFTFTFDNNMWVYFTNNIHAPYVPRTPYIYLKTYMHMPAALF
jgi:hypothetical protein